MAYKFYVFLQFDLIKSYKSDFQHSLKGLPLVVIKSILSSFTTLPIQSVGEFIKNMLPLALASTCIYQ